MLGSAIAKEMATRATFTKKEKKGVLMSSTLKKVLVQASLGTIMPGIGTAQGAGVGAVVGDFWTI
jgi:hypothetical protein